MEICNCTLLLGGNRNFTVSKYGLTVAEAIVLGHINKPSSLEDIVVIDDVEVDMNAERARLAEKYPAAGEFIESAFGGVRADAPQTFAEAKFQATAAPKRASKSEQTEPQTQPAGPEASPEAAAPSQPQAPEQPQTSADNADGDDTGGDDPLLS